MIGVFDSGHGGLTVLRALTAALPDRSFRYLGDHGNAPYGNRTPEQIYRLTVASVERLFERDCRLVVLACNTAAAIALRRLQQDWLPHSFPDRRVLGVLVPMVEAITGVPWMADLPAARGAGADRVIAVFATRRTVESEAYPREIGKRAPEVTVIQQGCPRLVALIEAGAARQALRSAVASYAEALLSRLSGRRLHAVMLGCTHYPLVADLFAEALPSDVEMLSQPELTARSLAAYLDRHPEFDMQRGSPQVEFLTSGDPARVSRLARSFFGSAAEFRGLGKAHAA